MFTKILCLAIAVAAAQATGDFTVLHSPDSVDFHGNEEVPQSLLKEIFSAALGYTVKGRGSWSGMSIRDPFNLPEAVVGITVEGVKSIASPRGKHYPLNTDEDEETTWQALSGRVEERNKMNTLVRINLEDGFDALGQSVMGELKPMPIDKSTLKSLSVENKPDREILEQIELVNAISKKVSSTIVANNKSDVYWFVVSALSALRDFHGDDSPAVKEATVLLNDALSRLCNAFMDVYDGKVLVAVFTNDATNVRHTRAASDEATGRVDNITSSTVKASKAYDDTYPVMFNIFLWFGVAFLFALIAICITIGDMDPGRDSIIYRMTSNRMKKDN